MKIIHKLKYVATLPISFILSKKYAAPTVLSDRETVQYILQKGCSVCRFGDGELNLMKGIGIKFQKFDGTLRRRLQEIAMSNQTERALICIPNIFATLDAFTKESGDWWKKYVRCTRGYWYKMFRNGPYGDTNVTRFYVENKDKDRDEYVKQLKEIWREKRVLIVEGAKSRLGMGNDLFSNTADIKRLICPSADAFKVYPQILEETKQKIGTGHYDLMICALGPTATVLCYDTASEIQSLDLGHVDIEYEWYLRKAQSKQAICNKSVTEVEDGCGDDVDYTYREQIIGVIK